MKELIFQMELMMMCQINKKNACFVIIGIFQIRTLAMDHIFVMDAIIWCKNAVNLKIMLLFMLKKVYTEFIYYIGVNMKQKKLMTNSNLIDKKCVL